MTAVTVAAHNTVLLRNSRVAAQLLCAVAACLEKVDSTGKEGSALVLQGSALVLQSSTPLPLQQVNHELDELRGAVRESGNSQLVELLHTNTIGGTRECYSEVSHVQRMALVHSTPQGRAKYCPISVCSSYWLWPECLGGQC